MLDYRKILKKKSKSELVRMIEGLLIKLDKYETMLKIIKKKMDEKDKEVT